jgi:ribonuclease P protein subunit POP4
MPITRENLPCHELIGLDVEIMQSADQSLVGVKGRIINETKNTVSIEKENGKEVTIAKGIATFKFKIAMRCENENKNDNNEKKSEERKRSEAIRDTHITIDGAQLVGRPEERLKKFRFARTNMNKMKNIRKKFR